jgi:hypothetical protein
MHHLRPIRYLGAAAVLTIALSGCDSNGIPTAPQPVRSLASANVPPTPHPSLDRTISGTVWVHGSSGMHPASGAILAGFVETDREGYAMGRLPVGADGRYQVSVPGTAVRVRLKAVTATSYQPCGVTVTPAQHVVQDIHIVSDSRLLGGNLPSQLPITGPVLSGIVYELTPDGRRPVPDARVELDGLWGLGLVTATTLTDADGRYTLCGVAQLPGLTVYASKPGYALFEEWRDLIGRTTLDIELQRGG